MQWGENLLPTRTAGFDASEWGASGQYDDGAHQAWRRGAVDLEDPRERRRNRRARGAERERERGTRNSGYERDTS
ncbi:hypothetical protein CIPAW_03G283800 [Carya illinoinensis]|uniref:Uncharacterized protein n=1 Tax=Carya illinoinensis TaxID=32201 RepID=A0A8T1R7D3_CARIL|nr:hypothetical protein CIPAW_03G283800 [Carya illinoinensis]